jgi:serine-type D-Ala-D-Ala carboxypeptidase
VDQIAAVLDEMFARGVGSGAALSIGDAGREVERMFRGTTRRLPSPGVPVDTHTWFDVASLTKPMATVASAMVLVGDGALDLDDPISRWLPAATSTGTVRQLLGHAAGCAAHVEFFKRLRVGTHEDPRAELVAMAGAEPSGPPGVTAVYSDLGYIMLGAIIERVANAPLEEAFASLVAEPLGIGARYAPTISALSPGGNYTKSEGAEQRLGGARPIAGQERAPTPFGENVAATEIDERTGVSVVVQGRVHDENAWYGGDVCGHAGLFARLDDVAMFAAAIVDTAAGIPRGRLRTEVVNHFLTTPAAPAASWRLGWDTPSSTPGVSHAGDRWSRVGAVGHLGFTGVSLWLDLPNRRWVTLLTNRVHPTRFGDSPEAIKQLRRRVNDFAVMMLGG